MSNSLRPSGRHGLVTKKVGMTRIFLDDGRQVPVSVLHVQDAQVVATMTEEKNGYTAVQVGAFAQKAQRLSKAVQGHLKKAGVEAKQILAEFRVDADKLLPVGTVLSVDHFVPGQLVDITGTTKGRGFSGGMRRWNFGGLRATHGVSVSHRSIGGTAGRQDPGRVMKEKKMPGHYGVEKVTMQNLEVVRVDAEKGLILVKGSVPGAKNGFLYIQDAVKDTKAAQAK